MQQKHVRRIRGNIAVRVLAYPVEQVIRKNHLQQFKNSQYPEYIRALKGIHKGESCFIIGNGPSLRSDDLELLYKAGIVCFGANRIYRIFPKTHWRPTYYMVMDRDVIADDFDNIKDIDVETMFINFNYISKKISQKKNIHCLCPYEPFLLNPYHLTATSLSEDPSDYSAKVSTVTVTSIELAIYMGFKKIYLLGVDNNYMHTRKKDGTVEIDHNMTSSYFIGGEPSESLGPSIISIEYMNEAYIVAKDFAEKHGVKIYNATRGGKLEAFERVDFDELMS